MDCLGQLVSTIKDIVLAIAAAVGAYVAFQGLSTWNRQLKGGVEYDLARRLVKCAYRLREAIKGVRDPFMFAEEMSSPPEHKAKEMSQDQLKHYGVANAYQKRWDSVQLVRTELQSELLEAEVLWGKEIHEKFDALFNLQIELNTYVRFYLLASNPNAEARQDYQEVLRAKRNILYAMDGSDKPDEFGDEINLAIQHIESYVKPHLRQ